VLNMSTKDPEAQLAAPDPLQETTPLLGSGLDEVENGGYKSVANGNGSDPGIEVVGRENEDRGGSGGVKKINPAGILSLLMIGVFISNADGSLVITT